MPPINIANAPEAFFTIRLGTAKMLKKDYAEYKAVWFYGLSTKRYSIYTIINEDYKILKASAHGLGHLQSPLGERDKWHETIWYDLVRLHHKKINETQLREIYSLYPEVSKLAITTPEALLRVKSINEGKPYSQQIKPYGFMMVGVGTTKINGNIVKPIAPFNKDLQNITEQPFIDGSTGHTMQGEKYWNNMGQRIFQYLDYKDGKFNGEQGHLTRKTIRITNKIVLGKEHDELQEDQEPLEGPYRPNIYYNPKQAKEIILKMKIKEATEKGIARATFFRIKNQIQKGNKINTNIKTIQKLLQ